jgi:arylsulfatase A-like enzyme
MPRICWSTAGACGKGTHAPYHPQRRYIEQFAPDVLNDAEARQYLRRFNGDVFGWLAPIADTMPEQHKSTLDGIYNAEVANQDEHLGTFFNRLRESGALDRTLLVICADHGEHLGEKQLIGHSFSVYNELVHVPLIIRDPSGNFSRRSTPDTPVSTRRLFHTVLTAAGMADSQEEAHALQRNAESDPDGGVVFAEGVPSNNVLNLVRRFRPELVRERRYDLTRRAVVQNADKLILTGNVRRELFDVVRDPAELHNLASQEPEKVDTLRERLLCFEHEMDEAALTAGRINGQDDPQLRRQLRALGYLE